ncbi:MAG: ribbon-helix-helix domain-containing protein [Sphingomonadales bacterium]|nr:ribbon-helix-helix domain-containing protein [Sphingomonadales bacterium]MDE2170339.1 ribbon-helix-helix domain-containing protein [Sphingomonadales bacterium]
MSTPYHPPVKRSVEIAGHKTSISLEPLFWDWLRESARVLSVPVNALVARIDAQRIAAPEPPGLAGAIRLWLVMQAPIQPSATMNDSDIEDSAAVHQDIGIDAPTGVEPASFLQRGHLP